MVYPLALAVKPHILILPVAAPQVLGFVLLPAVFVIVGQVTQAGSFTAPFWLLPMVWPVPAIVGTPSVVVVLPTVLPKFWVTGLVEVPVYPVPLLPPAMLEFTKLAVVNAAPPSMASEQPSPSESRSKLFGIPSPSVSTVAS
ncbi:hypothetical protein MCERE19_03294 [Spirosomataceae bacterium]